VDGRSLGQKHKVCLFDRIDKHKLLMFSNLFFDPRSKLGAGARHRRFAAASFAVREPYDVRRRLLSVTP
jgi:hypothetical protein